MSCSQCFDEQGRNLSPTKVNESFVFDCAAARISPRLLQIQRGEESTRTGMT